jgi:error-prone DNA polymerase
VDLQRSRAKCSLENGAIRLGLNYVAYLADSDAARIVALRNEAPFVSLADFCRRTRLARRVIENLILCGALDGWGITRRELLWELGKLRYERDELPLVFREDKVELPPLSASDKTAAEYGVLGLSVGAHVMTEYRTWLLDHHILGSQDLEACPAGQQVKVAGLLVIHQAPPSARGYHFLTLEDWAGMMNVIIRPDLYSRHRRVLRESPLLIVEGTVQRQEGVINLIASQASPLTQLVA